MHICSLVMYCGRMAEDMAVDSQLKYFTAVLILTITPLAIAFAN